MRLFPSEITGNGSLGTTGALMFAFAALAIVVFFVAQELLVWIGALVLFLAVLYGMKSQRARRLGGFSSRY